MVPPIAPGAAKVLPLSKLAFKFGTFVKDATENGAVPVATVDVMTPPVLMPVVAVNKPEADKVVNAPVFAAVEPMVPGDAQLPLCNQFEFKLVTIFVDATVNGAVPVASVDVITPLVAILVAGVPLPIEPGLAKVLPLSKLAFIFGTTVVDAIENVAVPVACEEVITPLTEILVAGVPLPMAPGFEKVLPPTRHQAREMQPRMER